MSKRIAILIVIVAQLVVLAVLRAQTPSPKASPGTSDDKWNNVPPSKPEYARKKAGPAPRRDLSGIWDGTAEGGVQAKGTKEYVDSPGARDVPYTADGKAARALNKPGETPEPIATGDINDPVDTCDPQGFPRMDLHQMKVIEIAQTEKQIVLLDQFYDNWRVIWTDGRPFPKEPDPRWNGYSVGKWEDDYTFVVQTVGTDERTWLDNAGRPHSDALQVEERFHRVDFDTLQLTVTISDPKFYTQPWAALNKFVLHRLPDDFDMREVICSVSEKQQPPK